MAVKSAFDKRAREMRESTGIDMRSSKHGACCDGRGKTQSKTETVWGRTSEDRVVKESANEKQEVSLIEFVVMLE